MAWLKQVVFGSICIVMVVEIYLTGLAFAQTLPQIPKKKGHPKLESVLFDLVDIEEKRDLPIVTYSPERGISTLTTKSGSLSTFLLNRAN